MDICTHMSSVRSSDIQMTGCYHLQVLCQAFYGCLADIPNLHLSGWCNPSIRSSCRVHHSWNLRSSHILQWNTHVHCPRKLQQQDQWPWHGWSLPNSLEHNCKHGIYFAKSGSLLAYGCVDNSRLQSTYGWALGPALSSEKAGRRGSKCMHRCGRKLHR